eukprot:6115494-Amphidinium_carterae.1
MMRPRRRCGATRGLRTAQVVSDQSPGVTLRPSCNLRSRTSEGRGLGPGRADADHMSCNNLAISRCHSCQRAPTLSQSSSASAICNTVGSQCTNLSSHRF